jgi:hypothetical protein
LELGYSLLSSSQNIDSSSFDLLGHSFEHAIIF